MQFQMPNSFQTSLCCCVLVAAMWTTTQSFNLMTCMTLTLLHLCLTATTLWTVYTTTSQHQKKKKHLPEKRITENLINSVETS